MRKVLASAGTVALLASAALAQTTTPQSGGGLADKLINQPGTAPWYVFGASQTNEALPNGGPQGYPATRVTVAAKGANPWDAGAVSPIAKPIGAGDTLLVAVYLRAPMLKDGETTPISYFGLGQSAAPYEMIVSGSANLTNQWKLFYASGKAAKAYPAEGVSVGVHLAADKHVVDLGPVKVFDLGPDFDPARLPKNQ